MKISGEGYTVVNASKLVLGRMASILAKRLLLGEFIVIVNAEKAVLSGKRQTKIQEWKEFLEVGHHRKGPFHPRRPDQLVRRTIWGMLPHRLPKGQRAFKRLRVHLGVPEELEHVTLQTIPEANATKIKGPYVTVEEISKEIGYKPVGK